MRTGPLKGQALLSLLRSSASSPLTQQSPFQLGPKPVSPGIGPGSGGPGAGSGMGPGQPMGLGLPPGLTPPPGMGPIGMAPPPGMGPRGMTPPVPMMDPIPANRVYNTAQEAVQRTAHSPTPPLAVPPTTDTLGAAAPKKVVGTYRYTRGQEGILLLALNNGKSPCSLSNVSRHIIAGSNKDDAVFDTEGAVVRPGGAMVVIWQVPESMYMDKENVNLSIGLTR